MTNLSTIAKYRPVLTAEQITHICKLCRIDASKTSIEILAILAGFEFKIKAGAIVPAYTETHKPTVFESLGFDEPRMPEVTSGNPDGFPSVSPEKLYQAWLENPDSLGVEELKKVQFYRYYNGKMTPDQERLYESENLT